VLPMVSNILLYNMILYFYSKYSSELIIYKTVACLILK
jgi:hypothetical protein